MFCQNQPKRTETSVPSIGTKKTASKLSFIVLYVLSK